MAFGNRRLRAPKDYADMSAQRGTVAGAGSSDWVPVIVHDVTIAITIASTITNSTTNVIITTMSTRTMMTSHISQCLWVVAARPELWWG